MYVHFMPLYRWWRDDRNEGERSNISPQQFIPENGYSGIHRASVCKPGCRAQSGGFIASAREHTVAHKQVSRQLVVELENDLN